MAPAAQTEHGLNRRFWTWANFSRDRIGRPKAAQPPDDEPQQVDHRSIPWVIG
jgi:hypothetical protein